MLRLLLTLSSAALAAGLLLRPRTRRLTASASSSSSWTVAPASKVRTAVSNATEEILLKAWRTDDELSSFDDTLLHEPHVHHTLGLEAHGALVYSQPSSSSKPSPGILLVHTAVGPQDLFLRWRAEALASRGYVVLIADLLGDALGNGWDPEFAAPRRQVYVDERPLLGRRMRAALEELKSLPNVDETRLAAVGYCFGGRAVVDLLKIAPAEATGLRGVVSFHGVVDDVDPPEGDAASAPVGRALLCHAENDPFVPRPRLDACLESLSRIGCVWELQSFGGMAKHAFTNPAQALNPRTEFGYDPIAERSSWAAAIFFLEDVLA